MKKLFLKSYEIFVQQNANKSCTIISLENQKQSATTIILILKALFLRLAEWIVS